MQINFDLAEARCRTAFLRLGVGPSWQGRIPLPSPYLRVFGVTRNSAGAVLPACSVDLFQTMDDKLVDRAVSDANGNYEFRTAAVDLQYYVLAYKAGSPDVSGTTVNTLIGT